MENKIRIKWGDVEVEYEGSEVFLKKELPAILDAVAKLHGGGGSAPQPPGRHVRPVRTGKGLESTSAYASKMGGNTCGKLALAAAGKLTVTDAHETFTRDQLLDEMKNATSYYSANYRKNLSPYLKRLVQSGKLNELGGEKYALAEEGRKLVEKALA